MPCWLHGCALFKDTFCKGQAPPAVCGAAAQRRYGFLALEDSRSHTAMHHSRCNSSGREIGSSQKLRIRTHNTSKRANLGARFRPRGHWDRLNATYSPGGNVRHTFYKNKFHSCPLHGLFCRRKCKKWRLLVLAVLLPSHWSFSTEPMLHHP